MFGHRFPRRIFIGAASNTFPIGKNEPLMKANFPDDVLGHFRASGSELRIAYAGSIAGPLKPIRCVLQWLARRRDSPAAFLLDSADYEFRWH